MQPGDTVDSIADRTGVPLGQLMALNSMPDQDIYAGEPLRLVASAPELGNPATRRRPRSRSRRCRRTARRTTAVALASTSALSAQPVSRAGQAEGPQLLPGATGPGPQSADPVDYSVAADGSVRVVAAETLGHYADWLGTSAARLRALNHLHGRRPLVMGRRVVLAFNTVTATQFEQRRREYHERLQAAYFAAHRIVGTETYMARRGDSLWNITQHDLKVPIWLLQQYNPDLDFSDLKPGTVRRAAEDRGRDAARDSCDVYVFSRVTSRLSIIRSDAWHEMLDCFDCWPVCSAARGRTRPITPINL